MGLMNDVLHPFIRTSVIAFLGDILIFSKDWKQHLRHVDDVLSTLEHEQLYCKASKCVFATDFGRFLGHIGTGDTIGPDPGMLQAVTNWPAPSSMKEVRRFLGFANYFRRFIIQQKKRLFLKGESTWQLCIPSGPSRNKLLHLSNDITLTGYSSRDRTYSRLARSYYWPKMSQDVTRYVKSCDTCQRVKGDRSEENLLRHLPVPSRICFSLVTMDKERNRS